MQVTTATQTLSTTWAKKLEIKAKRQAITTMEKEMKDAKRQEIEVGTGSSTITIILCSAAFLFLLRARPCRSYTIP